MKKLLGLVVLLGFACCLGCSEPANKSEPIPDTKVPAKAESKSGKVIKDSDGSFKAWASREAARREATEQEAARREAAQREITRQEAIKKIQDADASLKAAEREIASREAIIEENQEALRLSAERFGAMDPRDRVRAVAAMNALRAGQFVDEQDLEILERIGSAEATQFIGRYRRKKAYQDLGGKKQYEAQFGRDSDAEQFGAMYPGSRIRAVSAMNALRAGQFVDEPDLEILERVGGIEATQLIARERKRRAYEQLGGKEKYKAQFGKEER
jgi:hypothetical protein